MAHLLMIESWVGGTGRIFPAAIMPLVAVHFVNNTGMAAAAVGLASFTIFLACVAVFALGALMTRPTQQTLIASMANPQALAHSSASAPWRWRSAAGWAARPVAGSSTCRVRMDGPRCRGRSSVASALSVGWDCSC